MRISLSVTIFAMSALLLTSNIYAASYRCVGMDGEGEKINVLYDEGTNTVNINGTVLKVTSGTKGKNGVATENYKTEDDNEVYASLVVESDDKITLRQYNAEDDEVIATVPLACE